MIRINRKKDIISLAEVLDLIKVKLDFLKKGEKKK